MKKGYYIHFNVAASAGVMKKVAMQMKEFRKYFEMYEIDVEDISRSLIERIAGLWPSCSIARSYGEALRQIEKPDFIYVRRAVADKEYMLFLETIRKRYPSCKVIVEIFTYPYLKDDYGRWNAWPFLIKELIYRSRYKRYVDRFVTYSDDEIIYEVPTIRTINGICVEQVKTVSEIMKDDTIDLVTAAYMQKHHGYERVIWGLHEYYQQGGDRNIILHLIGDGPEKAKYKKIVDKCGLESHVIFYPTLTGAELDHVYDVADIALASFGMYKIGISKLSALKTREYLAKGIPIATGCQIDILKEGEFPYLCQFPNRNEKIDMEKMISFYDKIYGNMERKEVIGRIRRFALENADNSIAMKPVIQYIAEGI